ncbi:MAG: hypothetical protein LIO53_00190 [Oscillospiraceae bacterium]|nr:hypothetical protein [Oscillospiraceae bacterium]
MEQISNYKKGHDDELIEVLSEISIVSGRMARNLKILSASKRLHKGGQKK